MEFGAGMLGMKGVLRKKKTANGRVFEDTIPNRKRSHQ